MNLKCPAAAAAAEMLWKKCPNVFNQKRGRSLTILQSNIFGQFWLVWAVSVYYILYLHLVSIFFIYM